MTNRDIDSIFSTAPPFFINQKSMEKWMMSSKAFTRGELNVFKRLKPEMREDVRTQYNKADDKVQNLRIVKDTLNQYHLVNCVMNK